MIFTKFRYDRLTVIKRSQRVEKGVHLEKNAVLHAEETARKRAGFCILRGRTYIGTSPEQKAESAKNRTTVRFLFFSKFCLMETIL